MFLSRMIRDCYFIIIKHRFRLEFRLFDLLMDTIENKEYKQTFERYTGLFLLNNFLFFIGNDRDTLLTLIRPSRRKLQMRWFFDVSKVKEWSFF